MRTPETSASLRPAAPAPGSLPRRKIRPSPPPPQAAAALGASQQLLRQTPERVALYDAQTQVAGEDAVVSVRGGRTVASTRVSYRAAEPLYEASCGVAGPQAWPPSNSLEVFAGYLRTSAAFSNPSVYG